MAKFTTELRTVIECKYPLKALMTKQDNPSVYPVFNESYRGEINQAIIRHFYFREIGFETVERFDWCLDDTLHMIMPYYNQLFESALLEIKNPLSEYDMTETMNKSETGKTTDDTTTNSNSTGENTSTASGTNNGTENGQNKEVGSVPADGLVQMNAIEENVYANRAVLRNNSGTTHNETTGTTTTNDTQNGEVEYTGTRNNNVDTDYTKKLVGVNGRSQAELLIKYRESFISVLKELLKDKDLNQCFMGVY